MKERPIIFSSDMVRAILEGSKIQTRRPLKPQPKEIYGNGEWYPDRYNHGEWWCFWGKKEFDVVNKCGLPEFKCPYGEIGDHLWVRETFRYGEYGFVYRASGDGAGYWQPSIHMPRKASRITLEITNIRVEKVCDISIEDAQKEGIQPVGQEGDGRRWRGSFRDLWDSIYLKKGLGWIQNPWVWVIEFKEL